MVIAAFVVFGALLAAWLVVPAERTGMARVAEQRRADVTPPMAEPPADSVRIPRELLLSAVPRVVQLVAAGWYAHSGARSGSCLPR